MEWETEAWRWPEDVLYLPCYQAFSASSDTYATALFTVSSLWSW